MSKNITKSALTALFVLSGAIAAYYFASYYFITPDDSRHNQATMRAAQSGKPPSTAIGWAARIDLLAGAKASGMQDAAEGQAGLGRFADPFGLAQDRAGNLYVADAGENNRIRKISPGGMVSTLAGASEGFADGAGAAAAFNTPSGLATDDAGNVYVADTGNNAIRKITPQGQVITLAGNGKAGYRDGPANMAQFNGPLGVAVDKSGKVYVADTYNDRIRVIGTDGQVQTLAGGAHPGYKDGLGGDALFDTPCALALDAAGNLFIADTHNHAIRKLSNIVSNIVSNNVSNNVSTSGQVTTLVRSMPDEREALLRRPLGLAVTHDGVLYVSEGARGRILQIAPNGEVHGLTGIGIDIAIGDDHAARLKNPAGIILDGAGGLYVADSGNFGVVTVRAHTAATAATATTTTATTANTATTTAIAPQPPTAAVKSPPFPWPLTPQNKWHEIVGTMGEVRGNYDGESRDHFHSGLDMQAAIGTPVLAVANEKVSSPVPNWGFGELHEGMAIGAMAYIHMRVGRTGKDAALGGPIAASFDPRFQFINDDKGKLARVRVKRGTRFRIGDQIGSVNRMFHVHLEFSPGDRQVNPLTLAFNGFNDSIAPRIDEIALFDAAQHPLTKKRARRLLVPKNPGQFSIVVDAYDQTDGNAKRRRLGLYKLGYQILRADGKPMPGYEQPHINLEFNRLPPDHDAVKIAYADNSGITEHGSAATRFLYVVTNTVRDGHAKTGTWRAADLPQGDYIVRIFAADYAGNEAVGGRDLPITIE